MLPVIDLQARFGRQRAVVGKKSCIVIFDAVPNHKRTAEGRKAGPANGSNSACSPTP